MIPEKDPIISGMRVRQDEGLLYVVEDVRQDTTGYEVNRQLGGLVVNYTQIEQGSFPPGTPWSKDEAEFREYFTIDEPEQAAEKEPENFAQVSYEHDESMTTLLVDEITGCVTAAVTLKDMQDFAIEHGHGKLIATRAYNGLNKAVVAQRGYKPIEQGVIQIDYFVAGIVVDDDGLLSDNRAWGIKLIDLPILINFLPQGQYGAKSYEFFQAFSTKLLNPSDIK